MTSTLRHLAEYDGWIFSTSGQTAQKGRNGTARRLTDLHYHDQWEWIMPVYSKLCAMATVEHRNLFIAIQSAILLNDIEVAGELCGKLAKCIKEKSNDKAIMNI
jgi:hypothetical protein